jgi:hypothetical protein
MISGKGGGVISTGAFFKVISEELLIVGFSASLLS